jgi:osmotically-inducible protein OsmY
MLGGIYSAGAQTVPRPAEQARDPSKLVHPEMIVAIALKSNPLTAPYAISSTWRDGAVVLAGRVGTKQVHDAAVRMAIDVGAPFRDNLVIDTATAHAVALNASSLAASTTSAPYFYPPPLMGRLDDPFFGYVPPLVSFPPWWPRRSDPGSFVEPRRVPNVPGSATRDAPGQKGAAASGWQPLTVPAVKGEVEISVDALGQVVLRGVVASEEAGREIEQAARSVPGVTRVETDFQVVPRRADSDASPPPPPPQPMLRPATPEGAPKAPAPRTERVRPKALSVAPAALDPAALTLRVVDALHRRPLAAALPVKVRSSDGVVVLSGEVPSAYEAMMVYRAAQQTPGVREIEDHLEFLVPDEDHANPLVQKGRPEDIEPYLASQVRRHLGDLAQLDRISAHGDVLELKGTLLHAEDQDRLQAILRSIPLLHGFRLEPKFATDQ